MSLRLCLYLSGGRLAIMALTNANVVFACMCAGRSMLICVAGLKDLTWFAG
jgi:hypothetical protein